jgi:hypothetical protein
MSNIKISVLSLVGNPSLLSLYSTYIQTVDEIARNRLQQKLERTLGEKVFGAKKVSGNPRLIQDWYISDTEAAKEITKNLGIFEIDEDGQLRIEAKLQRKGESSRTVTTIGGSTLNNSIIAEIISKTNKTETPNVADRVFKSLRRVKSGTNLFNYLEKNAPTTIHNQAYQKSKNLVIFTKTEGSILAYQIFFPRKKFKAPIFGASIDVEGNINYFIQTSFQKQIVQAASESVIDINLQNIKEQREYTNRFAAAAAKSIKPTKINTSTIQFSTRAPGRKTRPTEKIDIIYYTTNSMPLSKATVRKGKKFTFVGTGPSLIDITVAVRGRTRLRMKRGSGLPKPPKIYERTGDFRSSIEAVADLRSNTIEYFYTPYYKRLENYGYEITELVEGSIRSVAQAQFNKRFNLTRRNT